MQTQHRGIIISHTHWDRAWYLPFQAFRFRLVRMVDHLLNLLEQNPRFRAFTLDGQTVLLEDYQEIRPKQKERLHSLIQSGRLLIGPWYTLPDLFLSSGEAVIRNLQVGQKLCEELGGYMAVGYVPDPFGHFAQLPQILHGFGIDTYIFMRGMDAETKETHGAVFDWEAPDGSTVLAVYQSQGYFPVAALGHPEPFGRFEGNEPKVSFAKERVSETLESMTPLQKERTLLLNNGLDHMPAQPELPDLIERLNEELETITLEQGTLPEFLNALKQESAPHHTHRGDLLGNVDHPILSSVYSTRMYLKQQNHHAQGWLTQYAEPLSAWMEACRLGEDARPFLEYAWRMLLRNHPHDDICGCSVDSVHDDDEYRFRQVDQIAEALLVEHLEHLLQKGFAAPSETGSHSSDVWVFNPHPWQQQYEVETSIYLANPDGEWGEPLPECQLLGCDADGSEIAITTLRSEANVVRSQFLETTWGRRYDITFKVTLPPLGYQLVHIYEYGYSRGAEGQRSRGESVTRIGEQPLVLENENYRVAVENGGLTLTEKETGITFPDALRFEYQLDAGDTYSFGPVPEEEPRWAKLESAQWHPELPKTLRLKHQLAVPAGYNRAHGSYGETTLHLTTEVWLNSHRSLSLSVCYDNTAENGRLRSVLPVGFATRTSLADGHFRLAPREKPSLRTPESHPERYQTYPGELDYPTHPQGDFVMVEGENYRVWVANQGLPEYELMKSEGNTHIAVTLHRAVDFLSVANGRIRRCQAGPSVPTPGAQCKRSMQANFAYGIGTLSQEAIIRHARTFAHPAWAREMPHLPYVKGNGQLPRQGSFLQIDNPAVLLSALKPARDKGTCVLRLYNATGEWQKTQICFGFPASTWCPTTLCETWDEEAVQAVEEQTIAIALAPHHIQTILIRNS